MLLLLLFLNLAAIEDHNYVLILRNGQKMTVKGPPQCQGRTCTVILRDGSKSSVPYGLIDRPATAEYNTFLEAKRERAEVERAYKEEQARLKAEAAVVDQKKEEPKQIVLTSTRELPKSAPNQQGTFGSSQSAPEDDASANTTTSPAETSPDSDPAQAQNPPPGGAADVKVDVRKATNDGVYIKKETISRFGNYSKVDLLVRSQTDINLRSVTIKAKVRFEDSAPKSYTINVPTTGLSYGGKSNASFRVKVKDEIIAVDYEIEFVTQT